MKKLLVLAVSAFCATGALYAEEDEAVPEGVKKVVLKLVSAETPSTRTEKWDPPAVSVTAETLPFSNQDIQGATSEEASRMEAENNRIRWENNRIRASIERKRDAEALAHYKGTMAKLEGTTFGRQILVAIDKFAGAAGEAFDPDCIEFFHLMDVLKEAKSDALLSGKKSQEMSAGYFLKLVFDDPQTKVAQGTVSGTAIKRTTVKIGVTYQVQDCVSGRIITSGNVKAEKSERDTGLGDVDERNLVVDAIDAALEDAAKRINKFFVAKTTIKVIPAKKDKEFDADSATVEVDGAQVETGDEISLLRGRHKIVVDLDGYKQAGSKYFDIKKSSTIKVKMRKVVEKKAEKEAAEE
jgi:hypothetical protein